MTTHDVLAYAVAEEIVRQVRAADPTWSAVLSTSAHATSSRTWPFPDFVVVDDISGTAVAAEFKPPDQTKREYLTGLGQAMTYTRDFHHALLVLPGVSDDDYPIADHVETVLAQDVAEPLPLGLIRYDPRTLAPGRVTFDVLRRLRPRTGTFTPHATIDESFWAKWREASPEEIGLFLEYLYEEGRKSHPHRSVRDRAFDRLWAEMVGGRTHHWGGGTRSLSDSPRNREGQGKNYRNFVSHIGWAAADGKLTEDGLEALRLVHLYGSDSRVFLDHLATAVLLSGKHLVLINRITDYQDAAGSFPTEPDWLEELEQNLENDGLLKRNPARHAAAVRKSARQFLKAEKQLWRNLGLLEPRGGRVYHPGRGFIFDWERITSLLTSASR